MCCLHVRVLLLNLVNMFFLLVELILSKGDDYTPQKGHLTFDNINLRNVKKEIQKYGGGGCWHSGKTLNSHL